jgi:hypothetical protein
VYAFAPIYSGFKVPEDIRTLLNTNDPLNESQRKSLQDILIHARSELKQFRWSQERGWYRTHQPAVASYKYDHEHALIERSIQRFEYGFSPVRHLPDDLLEVIFLDLSASDQRSRRDAGGNGVITNGPWHLGQVCRSWRHVARSCSKLWRTIELWLLSPDGDAFLLAEGLHLSGERTLSITLKSYKSIAQSPLVAVLHSQMHRVEFLALAFHTGEPIDKFMTSHRLRYEDMPALKKLKFRHISTPVGRFNDICPDLFRTGDMFPPSLTSIDVDFKLDLKSIVLPYRQLTSIHAEMDWNTLQSILRLCLSLHSLSWPYKCYGTLDYSMEEPSKTAQTLHHPKLRQLGAYLVSNKRLSLFQFPALSHLTVELHGDEDKDLALLGEHILRMTASSAPGPEPRDSLTTSEGIRTLQLTINNFGQRTMTPLLRALEAVKTIEHLTISIRYYETAMAELVDAFTIKLDNEDTLSDSEVLLPRLTELNIVFYAVPLPVNYLPKHNKHVTLAFLNTAFVSMIQSRQGTGKRPHSSLQRITVTPEVSRNVKSILRSAFESTDLESLEQLHCRGIDIDFSRIPSMDNIIMH